MNLSRELKRVKCFDLVSFDVFDTLILRTVLHPKDIFYLTGMSVLKSPSEAQKFQSARILAEHAARKKSLTGEVNIDDIYCSLEGYAKGICEQLKDAELRVEMDSCEPRNEVVKLFKALIDSGKNVVLISDMYLSSAFIKRMLEKCGIVGMKDTFVSNEYGCDKRSGKLFLEAQKNVKIFNGKHIHYGDSLKADFIGALKARVKPRFVFKRHFAQMLWRKFV